MVDDGQVNVIIAILQIELEKRTILKKDTITFVFPLILCLNKKIHGTNMKLSHNSTKAEKYVAVKWPISTI